MRRKALVVIGAAGTLLCGSAAAQNGSESLICNLSGNANYITPVIIDLDHHRVTMPNDHYTEAVSG